MGLVRKIFDIFCGDNNSGDVGIFGSKYNGSPVSSKDPDEIQRGLLGNETNWVKGWTKAIVTSQAPCLEDMNGAMYVFSYMIKYLFQTGIAEWNSEETYTQWALTQYQGSFYASIYNGDNVNQIPSNNPTYWRKLSFIQPLVAGNSYSVGDMVIHNGRTYVCVDNVVSASSNFVTDFYSGKWDDGNPAGTLLHSISWNKGTKPYHYFDVTGSDAGREVSISTYNSLYEVIGTAYNNCINFNTNTTYSNPAAGNFRLPDFRKSFFQNLGSNTRGSGHNASHSHSHNWGASKSLTHNHGFGSGVYGLGAKSSVTYSETPLAYASSSHYRAIVYNSGSWLDAYKLLNVTNTATLSIPALSMQSQGSGSVPEPNYYGVKILLKY